MSVPPAPKFTLRFRNRQNHELLGFLAERFGVSKNTLAEEMLDRELQAAALLLERDLTGTLDRLKRYRRDDHLDEAIEVFAQAEAYEDDPIKTRMVERPPARDAYGIEEAFA